MELKKSRSRKLIVAFVVLAFLALIFLFSGRKYPEEELLGPNYVESNIEKVLIGNKTAVVVLKARGSKIPIYVSASQGRAIATGKAGVKRNRPGTHDLIKSILDRRGIQVLALSIDKLKNGIYYGTLYIKKGKVEKFDVRPSDGMAIVTRVNKPIFVKKNLLYNETRKQNQTGKVRPKF